MAYTVGRTNVDPLLILVVHHVRVANMLPMPAGLQDGNFAKDSLLRAVDEPLSRGLIVSLSIHTEKLVFISAWIGPLDSLDNLKAVERPKRK